MELTSRQVDDIFAAMSEYEADHFGLKNGDDFPLIAKALLDSEQFKMATTAAASIGMLSVLSLPVENIPTEAAERIKIVEKVILNNTPLRGIMADIFFAGYKMGQAHSEVDSLKKLESL